MTLSILLTFFSSLVALPDTSIHTTVEAQAIVSDAGVTPFWMRSLQYGSVPMENPGLVLRAWHGKNYNLKKKYDWKYEVEATGWTGLQNDFWLTQAYVSGRRGKWELWAGRRKEVYGLGDTAMTSGFYSWSGNAVPMPKIQLGTRDYLNFAKGWLGIHMTYSHGWFDNQGALNNAMLHQKSLYARLGKPNALVSIFGGLNHQVSWGGEQKIKTGDVFDVYPSSLTAYFYVITLLKNRNIVKIDSNTSPDDANNQYGNHLGSIDLAMKFQPKWGTIIFYKQTAYETGRVFSLVTINDGIWGLSFKIKEKRFLQKILFEYMYTANQGLYQSGISKLLNFKDPHYPEIENYFNNYARGSFSYLGKAIGTPGIIIDSESLERGRFSFKRNGIKSIYFALSGILINDYTWYSKTLISQHGFIKNNGNDPKNRYFTFSPQFSFLIGVDKSIFQKINIDINLAYDQGEILSNTLGVNICAKYKLF
jgi:hypothetical protein